MDKTEKWIHHCLLPNIGRAVISLLGCVLVGGSGLTLRAQSVHVSVWTLAVDHSLESDLVFQSQSRNGAEAIVQVYEDIVHQQIAYIGMKSPSVPSAAINSIETPPSMDQEADAVIVDPLIAGALEIQSAYGVNLDFLLITQLSIAVKQGAFRLDAEVSGSHDIESLAFRNPEGTHVLLTVNHSKFPVSLEASWKDRLFTYNQTGNSIALFTWDPKSQLVALVAKKQERIAEDTLSLEARCSQASALGINLRCESPVVSCSIFPVYFTCDSRQITVPLVVTVESSPNKQTDSSNPSFVTITAVPDVGELTRLRILYAAQAAVNIRNNK